MFFMFLSKGPEQKEMIHLYRSNFETKLRERSFSNDTIYFFECLAGNVNTYIHIDIEDSDIWIDYLK